MWYSHSCSLRHFGTYVIPSEVVRLQDKAGISAVQAVRWDKLQHICCFNCLTLSSWTPLAPPPTAHLAAYHCQTFVTSSGLGCARFTDCLTFSSSLLTSPLLYPNSKSISTNIFSYLDRAPFSGTNSSQVLVIFILHYLLPL